MITSIIILTYNKIEYTRQCIESIRKHTLKDSYELIVVDNCSSDGTKEWLKEQNDIITLFNDTNVGFPKGCNQGIELSKGENILLLNNDTVVTENWLHNLATCLNSSPKFGAVGPVTNSCAYYQAIETNYSTMEEMQSFSEKYNVLDSSKWEERLKLIGFCLLIKKEVIEKIGFLDERFSPGNYEDDDYSIRIRREGYKLMLCKDTYIHHYGGTSFNENKEYSQLLINNEAKFKEKWGFTSAKNMEINRNLINLINKSPNEEFKVLQIGCGCGATLLYLKNNYKNAELYGVDINRKALEEADFLIKGLDEDVCNIDNICKCFSDVKFDYIFVNDILSASNENDKILSELKKLLINKGQIFIELKVDNLRNKEEKTEKLNMEKLIETLIETGYENIDGLAIKDEYEIKEYIFYGTSIKNEVMVNEKLTEDLEKNNGQKENEDIQLKLKFLLRRIENNIEVEESKEEVYNLLKLLKVNLEDILTCIARDIIKKDEVLNSIAVKFYIEGYYDNVIPLFQAGYEYNPKNVELTYNLACFLYELGEKKLALTYFEKIEGIDEEVDKFIIKLKEEL